MEQRTENNVMEVDNFREDNIVIPEKKKRGNYIKRNLEKKVTVKHFLNTKLHAIPPEYRGDSPQFNVYLQVTFLRKTTYTRSELSDTFSQERFDALLKYQPFLDCLNREKDFIIDYLQKDYNYKNRIFQDINETDNNEVTTKTVALKEFKEQISNWGKLYENKITKSIEVGLKSEIYEFAERKLINEIKKDIGKEKLDDKDFYFFMDTINSKYLPIWESLIYPKPLNALELLVYFENFDSDFSEIRKKYSSEIWCFNVYYYDFMCPHNNRQFKPIDYTINDLSLWNLNGTFETDFCNFFRNKSINVSSIIDDINKLAYSGRLEYRLNTMFYHYDYSENESKNLFFTKYNNL